jgi:hypothetical protein
MVRNIITSIAIAIPIVISSISAQDADPIEAARQAKLAAEKAAADAEAATGAAIEAAASRAAAEAREKVIAGREAEKARKLAEKEAAENAEVDAAAEAAALEARRKLAAELGLELEEVPDSSVSEELTVMEQEDNDSSENSSSPLKGYNFGLTGSAGFINGQYITNTPVGGSFVINTPFGFNICADNSLKFNLSLALCAYNGSGGDGEALNALLFGLGGNLTLMDFIFSESHLSYIGAGLGVRSFAGISLERILKNSLNLPFNLLVGGEGFITTKADEITENKTYWGGLGIRLDYSF